MDLDRLETLIGSDNLSKLRNLNILIVGIGGVGGYVLESLVRSGINNITVVDYDVIEPTNLNRQIITSLDNIGNYKVDEALKRYKSINPDINLDIYKTFLDESNISDINILKYDYVVDACDSIKTKLLLINKCIEYNKKIITSMGTAKKLDGSKMEIITLDKTSYDPLAKLIRKSIDKRYHKKVVTVCSKEKPLDINKLGSTSYVPGIAGLLITNYIINDFLSTQI